MLNRKASRTGEHSDEAAVLDVERLVQEQLQLGNKELGLWGEGDSELICCAEQQKGHPVCFGVWSDCSRVKFLTLGFFCLAEGLM